MTYLMVLLINYSFSSRKASFISGILRQVRVSTHKSALALVVLALIEDAKLDSLLPRKFSTRGYQRSINLSTVTSIKTIKTIVARSRSGEVVITRPFTISLERIII